MDQSNHKNKYSVIESLSLACKSFKEVLVFAVYGLFLRKSSVITTIRDRVIKSVLQLNKIAVKLVISLSNQAVNFPKSNNKLCTTLGCICCHGSDVGVQGLVGCYA